MSTDDSHRIANEDVLSILRRYARGEVSAYDAACEVQDLGLPEHPDPSAADVVVWARATGIGIPTPSEEEARAEADEILRRSRPAQDEPA